MRALIVAPVLLLVGVMLGGAPAAMAGPAAAQVAATDLSAQAARQRARTRIRVTPLRRGGTLVRECSFRLVREARASGSYVVPQQRCWWARR
jgi:hypothetical protein